MAGRSWERAAGWPGWPACTPAGRTGWSTFDCVENLTGVGAGFGAPVCTGFAPAPLPQPHPLPELAPHPPLPQPPLTPHPPPAEHVAAEGTRRADLAPAPSPAACTWQATTSASDPIAPSTDPVCDHFSSAAGITKHSSGFIAFPPFSGSLRMKAW